VTETEAQKLITTLVAAFPNTFARLGADQLKATMTTYRKLLADLDYSAAHAAVGRLLASSRFMPTIAEIREAALVTERGTRRAGGEAWGDFLAAVGKFGMNREPIFGDPLVARTVRALGWKELCQSETQVADRARFIELYDRLASTERTELQLPESLRKELPAPQRGTLPLSEALKLLPVPSDASTAGHQEWLEITGRKP